MPRSRTEDTGEMVDEPIVLKVTGHRMRTNIKNLSGYNLYIALRSIIIHCQSVDYMRIDGRCSL